MAAEDSEAAAVDLPNVEVVELRETSDQEPVGRTAEQVAEGAVQKDASAAQVVVVVDLRDDVVASAAQQEVDLRCDVVASAVVAHGCSPVEAGHGSAAAAETHHCQEAVLLLLSAPLPEAAE